MLGDALVAKRFLDNADLALLESSVDAQRFAGFWISLVDLGVGNWLGQLRLAWMDALRDFQIDASDRPTLVAVTRLSRSLRTQLFQALRQVRAPRSDGTWVDGSELSERELASTIVSIRRYGEPLLYGVDQSGDCRFWAPHELRSRFSGLSSKQIDATFADLRPATFVTFQISLAMVTGGEVGLISASEMQMKAKEKVPWDQFPADIRQMAGK
jgi:hypothetical protein